MSLKVKFDDRELLKWLNDQQRRQLPALESRALNKITGTVRTNTARKIVDKTGIKNRAGVGPKMGNDGGGLVFKRKSTPASLYTVIEGSRKPTPMSKKFFSVGQKKATKRKASSTSIKLKGRRVVFRNSQLSTSDNIRARGRYSGGRFRFDDSPTGALVRLRTFSIRSQLSENYITEKLNAVAFAAFDKELKRLLKMKGFI